MRAFSTPLLAAILVAAVSPALAAPSAAPPTAKPASAKPVSAGPAATGVISDVRCLLTMVALGQDKQRQQAAIIGAYFFAGRINARAPGFDLPAAVRAEGPKMTGPILEMESKRCGPMVEAGMRSLQASFGPPPGAQPPPGAAPAPAPSAPAAPAPAVPK